MANLNFDFYKWRERKTQNFDAKKITLTKAGKTYNVYDSIQENREDTEIYPTLEKYGCIDRMMLDKEGIYADFTTYKGLREMKEQQKFANEMFYNLPLDVRKKFNNDMYTFMKDGEKYVKELIDQEKTQKEKDKVNQTVAESSMNATPKTEAK